MTLRVVEAVWNLRSERSFAVIHAALAAARFRPDLRVVHFSVQGNHIHLIVEASGGAALSNAIRALTIRLAKRLNRMMGRRGPVFEDRFHSHVLRTPAEVRNALRYVVALILAPRSGGAADAAWPYPPIQPEPREANASWRVR